MAHCIARGWREEPSTSCGSAPPNAGALTVTHFSLTLRWESWSTHLTADKAFCPIHNSQNFRRSCRKSRGLPRGVKEAAKTSHFSSYHLTQLGPAFPSNMAPKPKSDIPMILPKGIVVNAPTVYDDVARLSTVPTEKAWEYWRSEFPIHRSPTFGHSATRGILSESSHLPSLYHHTQEAGGPDRSSLGELLVARHWQ